MCLCNNILTLSCVVKTKIKIDGIIDKQTPDRKEVYLSLIDIKSKIQELCQIEGLTFKELAIKSGMNENGLHNKFKRNSITFRDLMSLLSTLGYTISIVKDKDKQNIE